MAKTISGTVGSLVTLSLAGDNPATIATGALLQASLYGEGATAWTITNFGVVNATGSNFGITVHAGGVVSNQGTGTISASSGIYFQAGGAGTVVNAGKIIGTAGSGVTLAAGGAVTEQSGGTISGHTTGVAIAGAAGTVTNAGSIVGSGGTAVSLAAGFANRAVIDPGAVFTGTVDGGNTIGAASASTLELASGSATGTLGNLGAKYIHFASVTVDAGATWSLGTNTIASGYTLTNSGSIGTGVTLGSGSTLVNAAGSKITGNSPVVNGPTSGAVTIVNAGSISSSNYAVLLRTTAANRLVVDPGAAFTGSVFGGSTIASTTASTLEFASGAAAGTLAGLGSQIQGFANITVDAGATWSLTSDTIASGYTLTNSGTLTSAMTLASGALVSNASGGKITSSGVASVYSATTGADTVVNAGLIISAGAGSDTGVTLRDGGIVTNKTTGTVTGFQYGIYAGTAASSTLVNYGSISGTASSGKGIRLSGGGVVSNQSAGVISGVTDGVWLTSTTETVVNVGTITASGASGIGVYVKHGGIVTNQSGAMIAGGSYGVRFHAPGIGGITETLVNAGNISGSNYAVQFYQETNRLVIDPGATFGGVVDGGNSLTSVYASTLELASGASAGTLTELGGIYVNFADLTVDSGAHWTLTLGSQLPGYTINDSGTLTVKDGIGSAVTLGTGGVLTVASGGKVTASGTAVVGPSGSAGTVVNAGFISGSSDAVLFSAGAANRLVIDPGASFTGTVNGGNTVGATAASTLELASSASTGTLGGLGSKYVHFANLTIDPGASWSMTADTIASGYTLTNSGTIGSGVTLAGGGMLTNTAGGKITASATAVVGLAGAAVTVVNAGSISAATDAVLFTAGAADRLIIDPGAVFTGTVNGGNTIGAATASTLELAGGASASTLTGLGSKYIHFAAITVDSGGTWSLASGSITSGYTITDTGTLTNSGTLGSAVTLNANGVLTNVTGGKITTSGSASVYGAVVDASTVVNAGLISNSNTNIAAASGVTLRDGGTVTNLSTGTITAYKYGVYVTPSVSGTVVNYGTISGAASSGKGVHLAGGGLVSNKSSGTISGAAYGVWITGYSGTVVNAGLVTASGTPGIGVYLKHGGTVTNQAGGAIDGNKYGVKFVHKYTATVVNAGSISGSSAAVLFYAGVTNRLVIDPGAAFAGSVNGANTIGATASSALELASGAAAGTLSGLGTQFSHFANITVDYGATWSLTADSIGTGYTILDNGTLTNSGTLGAVVTLGAGAVLTNASGGKVTANSTAAVYGSATGPNTVVNAGVIINSNTGVSTASGVFLGDGGLITNQAGGSISGYKYGVFVDATGPGTVVNYGSINASGTVGRGVRLGGGGELLNQSTGRISGGKYGVVFNGTSATLINAGTIIANSAGAHYGVYIKKGGSATNQAGGAIIGTVDGVKFVGAYDVTLVNGGSISGSTDAVLFAAGQSNLLVVDPGAAFGGTVDGANTLGATAASTLELASGSATGTLSGLSTQFTRFSNIAINAGASWSLLSDTLASGYTIIDAGTLTNNGTLHATATLSGGVLTNAAGGTISVSGTAVVGAGGAAATVVNAGTISASSVAVSLQAGYANRLVFDPGAAFTGTVNGGNTIGATAASTLELASAASAGTLSGLGSQFVDFAHVTIDSGASWTLSGANTLAAGASLSSAGSLTNIGTLTDQGTLAATVTLGVGAVLSVTTGGRVTSSASASVYGAATGASTLVNAGLIANGNTAIGAAAGVTLRDGGTVTNLSTGAIIGSRYGVYVSQSATGTIVNAGSLTGTGTSGTGVRLAGGGQVSNTSGGVIGGIAYGVSFTGVAATLTNDGTITASGTTSVGVDVKRGGSITNQSGGVIGGGKYGIRFSNVVGTVVTGGGISGGTDAIRFVSGYSGNLLVIDPGASFTGKVDGGNAAVTGYTGTLELASAATAGTLSGLGSQFTRFSNLAIDTGARWTLLSDTLASGYTIVDSGTLTNTGTLRSAVTLGGGGVLTNVTGGTISATGTAIVGAGSGAATVVNAGSISASGVAVALHAGYANRLIIDPGAAFTGTVNGGNTIGGTSISTLELASGATTGTLSGLGSHYVNFARATIDAGAVWTLTGATNSLASGSSLTNLGTLTLLGATLTGNGVITNNGVILIDPSSMTISSLIGTGAVTIAANSTLDVTGTVSSGETIDLVTTSGAFYITPGTGGANFAGVIDGFATGNTIGLNGITDASSAHIINGNTLAITTSGEGTIDLTLNPSQSFTGATFNVATSSGNDLVTANNLPCFAAGTRIDTPDGPVAVEDLREGDLVCTASGGTRPVRWIGHRHLDLARHPDPLRAQPIRIRSDAIADGAPRRDLLVSPDHALFLDGGLIPARLLLNDATIHAEPVAAVTYYHVELDAHDVLLADGLAVESYLDTGNRGTFENAGLPLLLHPDFITANDQARRVADSCAPLIEDAARLEPIWRRLAHRGTALGYVLPAPEQTTADPALCLMVDGHRIFPVGVTGTRHLFLLPPTPREVRIVSRHAAPCDARPWIEDRRQLGVMVRQITLRRNTDEVVIPMDHPDLADGWWASELDAHTLWRWTDGDARLVLPEAGPGTLEIEVAGTLDYAIAPIAPRAAPRAPTLPTRRSCGAPSPASVSAPTSRSLPRPWAASSAVGWR